jgi:DNA-3-methyladenine glycosylase I
MTKDPRCPWCHGHDIYIRYHDEEWGVPVRDERKLFEMLILEGAQAGLSWLTILKKRDNYRRAFDGFDPARIAKYGDAKVRSLLADEGIVRNRLKIAATIANARALLAMDEPFVDFLWSFTGGSPKQNQRRSMRNLQPRTPESDAMSKALLARGFKFVGSTICHAFMQAVGMVNDHLVTCPRHRAVAKLA